LQQVPLQSFELYFSNCKGENQKRTPRFQKQKHCFFEGIGGFFVFTEKWCKKKNELISGGLFFSLLLHPWVF